MGRRSDFERIPRDAYDTPPEAVGPLLAHLRPETRYIEPCAGKGLLMDALDAAGHYCVEAWDIEPGRGDIEKGDALSLHPSESADYWITNPPWDRKLLHPMIEHLTRHMPAWLLFDAEWMHTRQSRPYMPWLRKVVSIGRVKWIPGTTMTGKDSCCWYLFDRAPQWGPTLFFGRTLRPNCAAVGESGGISAV